jgi:hypothetical protein
MSGIVFFQTENLEKLKRFYLKRVGAEIWKDQGKCLIFEDRGFKFAFCKSDKTPETCGVITFLFETRAEVDRVHSNLKDVAVSEPVSRKPEFNIYQFYANDPEGRTLEFQCFLD